MIVICPICLKAGEKVPLQSKVETQIGFCPKCEFILPVQYMVAGEANE